MQLLPGLEDNPLISRRNKLRILEQSHENGITFTPFTIYTIRLCFIVMWQIICILSSTLFMISDEETDKKVECDYEYTEYLRIKLVEKLRNLKVELSKLRKNSTKQIRSKVKEFNEEMKREKGNVWISYGLRCSLDDLSDLDKKTTDKYEVMKLIEQCIYTHHIVS